MSFSVRMPALGESVTEGTVTRWLKNEGDAVALDEPLLEVSTDKVDTEIPSPAAGTLTKIVVAVDQTVAVGTELALIDSANAALPSLFQPRHQLQLQLQFPHQLQLQFPHQLQLSLRLLLPQLEQQSSPCQPLGNP